VGGGKKASFFSFSVVRKTQTALTLCLRGVEMERRKGGKLATSTHILLFPMGKRGGEMQCFAYLTAGNKRIGGGKEGRGGKHASEPL